MTSSGLTFLSWVRTGLISGVGAPPGTSGNPLDASMPLAASLPVTLTMSGAGQASYPAGIAGPGDVIGLDPQQVIRTDPAAGATEIEPNYFALIEFDRPDLPWMLTPNAPSTAGPTATDARRGLRPWLCLIVVTDRALDAPTTLRPLPRITVSDAELPDLDTAWLWCHAQVLTAAGEDIRTLLATQPDRTLSRLIAPRRLKADTNYIACVVPTFEAGRRAGLGLEQPPNGVLAPAWAHGAAPRDVELPVYHSWRFSTSKTRGDFEQLARRIKALRFGQSGVRPLDVGDAAAGLLGPLGGAAAWTVPLEGVIVGDQIAPGSWPQPWRATLQEAIALRLASSDQELAPPTYGGLQAGHAGSLTAGQGAQWLRDLNLDPRYRATAALGTRLVQRYQEALMASAWEQTADMREANRLLRQAQLARAVGEMIERRISDPARVSADRLLQMTNAIHNQVRATSAGSTVAAAIANNATMRSAVSLPFRRVARPTGPLARRVAVAPLAPPVLRLGYPPEAAQAIRATPTLRAVTGTVDLGQVSAPGEEESLATLTAARVTRPIFPWEPEAPPPPSPPLPTAYLADLAVTMVERSESVWQSSTGIAHALDFEGVPQLGWEQQVSMPIMGGDTYYASAFVERDGAAGLLSANLVRYDANRDAFSASLEWTPGFMLEPRAAPFRVSDAPVQGEIPAGLAVTAADLTEKGQIDPVVLWSNFTDLPGTSARGAVTTLTIGRDLDPFSGAVRGDWVSLTGIFERGGPYSIAAAGRRLFILIGTTLWNIELGIREPSIWVHSSNTIELGAQLPEDFTTGAIAAADFGRGGGVDLLLYFVAGAGASLRAAYRIAFDLQPSGEVGAWGPALSSPVPAVGNEVSLLLGTANEAMMKQRVQMTAAFRAAAGAAQERQERIALISSPPQPQPALDAQRLADDVRQAIDPAISVERSAVVRIALETPIDPSAVTDRLQPLALTPSFPYPTFELMREAFPDRIYPGASGVPDNCVAALLPNRAAIEAFLIGLNHEMSRELLWRGFPVRHGTFFSRFWEAGREEIAPIEGWGAQSRLGAHGPGGVPQGTLLLVIRAELLRRIPDATIYAAPARPGASAGTRTVDTTKRRDPLFSGRLDANIRYFAFNLTAGEARGKGATDGWYFVFQQHPFSPRFGLDEAEGGYGGRPATWADLTWPQVAANEAAFKKVVYIDAGQGSPLAGVTLADGGSSALKHRWGFSAAHMAHITLQRPVLVAIHGSDLIHPGANP